MTVFTISVKSPNAQIDDFMNLPLDETWLSSVA